MRFSLADILKELCAARAKHPGNYHSPHEAYGVLQEEVQEFFEEVRKQKVSKAAMKKELVQIATVAVRAIEDLEL